MASKAGRKLETVWQSTWPAALAVWSPYIQLHDPTWCHTKSAEQKASLSGSFAMIRLVDHSVVISLKQIVEMGLESFATEILAHEIGHHVYCPANLTDNARLLARIRRGLPGVESYAPMVSNLYSDLLINDRLQRQESLDILGVYQAIGSASHSRLWTLYMRTYELLWKLSPRSLALADYDARLNQDAQLAARLVRSYSTEWLGGAGRFACLCLPYVVEDQEKAQQDFRAWCDTLGAGKGGIPNGLAEIDDEEEEGAIHPAEDPDLNGLGEPLETINTPIRGGRVAGENSGRKSIKDFRDPFDYAGLLEASGADLNKRTLTARYYRERAIPHLIPFPTRTAAVASDPFPEGFDVWETSDPLEDVDWLGSLTTSPVVIPGVTTRRRLMGQSPGNDPERVPVDLYLGIDCSGSMGDPAVRLSYPVMAGAIMVLSAMRVGARVKVVLSGEPGSSVATDGFIRDAETCLKTLTSYLGTGYAFGIHRLAETFPADFQSQRPVHILVISDSDMFRMLEEKGNDRLGWDIAREAVQRCGGGATYVLQLHSYHRRGGKGKSDPFLGRMESDGWNVHTVTNMEELVAFARDFSRRSYQEPRR